MILSTGLIDPLSLFLTHPHSYTCNELHRVGTHTPACVMYVIFRAGYFKIKLL